MIYELSRGMSYLKIRHPSISWYTIKIPVIASFVVTLTYYMIPAQPPLMGDSGLLKSILGIISTLPGFYFAALAAVVTFDRPGMDRELPSPAPEIDVKIQDKYEPVKLTLRQFLCYLFAYMTTLSLFICVLIVASISAYPSLIPHIQSLHEYIGIIKSVGLFVIMLPLSALAVGTLHGIFFLTERVHQPY